MYSQITTQDGGGGVQEGRMEEGTSKVGEGGCQWSWRWEVKDEAGQVKGLVVVTEKFGCGKQAFFCYQTRQSGP